jgi:LmbE family N-acetylglucosaminyl deacetylase
MTRSEIPSHSPARRFISGEGTDERTWNAATSLALLPLGDVAEWAERYRRIWLLSPHPDDEIMALGGALSRLSALGADLHIIAVTDGEASHVGSETWPADRLAATRPQEMLRGLDRLDIAAEVVRLGLPDGRVGAHRQDLLKALVERVGDEDLLLATCRFDGHPDHEACGDVAALAAELTGAKVYEYPVWLWHWARPDDKVVPWNRARRLPIDADLVERKRIAINEFASQIERDGPREPQLPPYVLSRFLRPYEVVFT